jgi:hypothetical protein
MLNENHLSIFCPDILDKKYAKLRFIRISYKPWAKDSQSLFEIKEKVFQIKERSWHGFCNGKKRPAQKVEITLAYFLIPKTVPSLHRFLGQKHCKQFLFTSH